MDGVGCEGAPKGLEAARCEGAPNEVVLADFWVNGFEVLAKAEKGVPPPAGADVLDVGAPKGFGFWPRAEGCPKAPPEPG